MEVDASPTMPKSRQRPASRVRRSAEVAQVDAPQLSGAARSRRRGGPRGSTKSKPIEVAGAFEEHDEGVSASTAGLIRPTHTTVIGVGDGSASRGCLPGVRTDGEGIILPSESWPLCLENAQLKRREEMGAIEPFTAPPMEPSSPPVLNTTRHLPKQGLPYMRQGISEELGSTVLQALR